MTPQATPWEQRLLRAALFVVPLLVLPGQPTFLARAVALQVVGAMALVALAARRWDWAAAGTILPLAFLIVPAALATLLSIDRDRSLLGPPERGGGLLVVLATAAFAAFVARRTASKLPAIRWWLAGVVMALLAYELAQILGIDPLRRNGPGFRVRGISGDPAVLGGTIAATLPYLLEGALDGREDRRDRWRLAVLAGIGVAGLLATFARGPVLAGGAGLWLVAVLRLVRGGHRRRARIALVVGVVALLGTATFWIAADLAQTPLRPGPGPAAAPGDGRDALIRRVLESPPHRVAFGYGPETTPLLVAAVEAPRAPAAPGDAPPAPARPDVFLELLATQGVFGLVGFCCLLAVCILRGIRRSDPRRDAPAASLTAIVFERLLGGDHATSSLLFAVAVGLLLAPGSEPASGSSRRERIAGQLVPPLVLLALVAVAAGLSGPKLAAAARWVPAAIVLAGLVAIAGRRPPRGAVVAALAGAAVALLWMLARS